MSINDSNYKKAITEIISVDNTGIGFSKPDGLSAGDLSRRNIQQNNVILQLLVNLHQKVDSIKAELNVLKNKEASSSTTSSLPEDLIKKLEGLTIGGEKPKPSSKKGTFFAYKDPYVILEEEKAKLKS